MKKQKINIIGLAVLVLSSSLATQTFAQTSQTGGQTGTQTNNTSNTSNGSDINSSDRGTFNTDREDFENASDYERNLRGECDSTCDLVPQNINPTSPNTPYVLNRPVAQTETRVLTCQQAGYPADWMGSVTQRRNYYTQNGVVIPSTIGPWVTINDSCRAPFPCASQVRSWTVSGQTCTGTVPALAHTASGSASDATPQTIGSATYSCNDGALTYVSGTCTYVPNNCSAAVSWTVGGNTCNGSVSIAHGASGSTTDSSGQTTGSATYSCNDGALTRVSGSCNYVPSGCGARNVSWTVNGNTCNSSVASSNSGVTRAANDTTAPTTGSTSFVCNNGSWSRTGGQTCVAAIVAAVDRYHFYICLRGKGQSAFGCTTQKWYPSPPSGSCSWVSSSTSSLPGYSAAAAYAKANADPLWGYTINSAKRCN